MPFKVTRTTISDIKPASPGGIINVNNGVVIFQNNNVYSIISSTFAACFYIQNSKIIIENSCFSMCAASGENERFGNVGYIISSSVKISEFSSFQCSFSTSQCGDSLFGFVSCGSSIKHFNSSFNLGVYGSPVFRSDNNASAYEVKFLTCLSCADWALLESYHVIYCEKCSFINSSHVTNYMIAAAQGSIFDTYYFFQMSSIPKFRCSVTLKNCCSDEVISGYALTIYANFNNVVLPVINKPACRGAFIFSSCKRQSRKNIAERLLIMNTE